jgi:hypothetical protein
VNEYGCYLLCLIEWAVRGAEKDLTDAEVIGIINFARVQKWLGPECYVEDAGKIYTHAAAKAWGTIKPAPAMWKVYERPELPNFIICNKKPMYTHFTAVLDWDDQWDPLPPNRPENHGYKPYSYRVFKEG